ncbi:hypothetical protein NEOLEDRAFT_1141574 [Neolentinus lepideus HHB14362 ss-1]|uniref:Uncharacterized protein n=1 Tax=Neolentinus lepideus HHB14362 ss-1 TaxID=1314782 RepID=A0A165NLJ3_9AGAM|nr:hypothetical protein NEOLEDRAFT_1141574 [Neolentinus lepideus HHB14362 ss-1]
MLEKFKSGEVDIPSSSIPDLTALRRLILRGVAHVGNYDVPGYVRKYVRAGWGCVEEQEVGFGFWFFGVVISCSRAIAITTPRSVSLITHHGISNGADHLGRLSGGEGHAGSHTVLRDCAFPAEGGDCEPIMVRLLRRDRSDGGACHWPSTTLSWFAPRLDDLVPFGYYLQDMEATITTLLALQVSTKYCDFVLLRVWIFDN